MYEFIKRICDVFLSLLSLLFLSPLYLLIAAIIKYDSRGTVFFVHERMGKGGRKIAVYKFRTMVSNAESIFQDMPHSSKQEFETNFKLKNDPRITCIGRFLRETSMDELPQLLNIIKGEMSIVGPRPVVEKELKKYGEYGYKLLSVKPGLTGNWQVNGRSNTSYEDRIRLDMEYIDKRNLWVDFIIILKTIRVVYKKIGAK